MIIDFHTHGKISSTFHFKEDEFVQKIDEAKSEGMDSLVLSEHCHADYFLEAYKYLENNFEYKNDYYDINGFKVFTGMEVTTNEGLDILCISRRENIIKLNKEVMDKKKNNFININDLFNLLNRNEFLVILAHPYRRHDLFPDIQKGIFDKIDAIEFNATDLYKNGIEKMKDEVIKLSKKLNIPIVGGSDSHYFLQIGSIKNIFNNECKTIKELKENIKLSNYKVAISNNLIIRVKSSIIIKELIKKDK